jgi:hypothetical protein
MTAVSNLYAAKLYSEHPIAIWPLDDDASYISLITDTQRRFESDSPYAGWTITNGTANDSITLPDIGSPFNSDIYAGIEGDIPVLDGTVIEALSPDLFLFSDCNEDLETFCISMYVYQNSNYISEYEIGYEYYDNDVSSWIQVTTTFDALPREGWIHLQDTFRIQEFDADYCHIIFRAIANTGGISEDYELILNGITVGQWSEAFTSVSLGSNPQAAPSPYTTFDALPADQYGLLADNAYYMIEDGNLLAKNTGIPMIFGSENVTRLYPTSDGSPSLIVPNKNMFTEYGRFQNFTFESWLRIRPVTKESRKIIGPVDTNDGIYVTEGFISLVINNRFISHNISEWYRPIILHVVMKDDSISMIINGEQVGQLNFDRRSLVFSESEWFGFYTYNDFDIFEIDCVSIFPYPVPVEIARKRFVWGQGTDPVELINDSFDGEEAVIQFSNARYNANRVYPDKERWDAGYYNNLIANTNSLSVPQYSLPNINLGNRDISEWYSDNKDLNDLLYPSGNHPLFFSFRPNIEDGVWEPVDGTNWTEQSYLNFSTLSFLSSPISAIYGIFEVEEEILSDRPLIKIVNSISGKSFDISINGYDVTYNFDGEELTGTGFSSGTSHFVVGFHIPSLSNAFNFELSSFFGSPEFLQVFIGGDESSTFEGKIYRIGFADQSNYNEISQHFDSDTGIVAYDDSALLEEHYASYTLSPFFRYNAFFLDISVSAQWEEYFPLSSFASYITKRDGSTAYDIDYLQFNFGYPSLIEIVETIVDNPDWIYQELFDEYNGPIQKSYEILDNAILTGYADYAALASNSITEYQIDTSGSSLDAYVTFQLLAEGADEPLSSFINTKNLTDSYTIYAEEENTNLDPYKAYKTKFRIVDGTVIYPPKTINFESVAIVVHFDINQDGIISNPLKIKDMQITSRSLNDNGLTPIGTKTGTNIYPYVRSGIYYSGKSKNPILIGKDNLPYLYLTEKTGIRVLEDSADKEYGIIVPINEQKSVNYSLGAVQLFMKYSILHPVPTTQVIFTLTHQDGVIEFTLTPDETAQRFYVGARDQLTKNTYSNLIIYQNGIQVDTPYILENEWNSLAVSFNTPLDFSGYAGSINLLYGCNFDKISFFKSTGLNEFSVIIPRNWSDVLYNDQAEDPLNIVDWQEWYDENGVLSIPNEWKDVYVLEETIQFSITPSDIYSAYCGTNIITSDDNTGVSIEEDDFTMFADQTWLKVVQKPV